MSEPIILLGATGSIGTQTLEILRFSFDYQLIGVSLNSRYEKLEPFLLYFDALKYVAISDEEKAKEFKMKHPSLTVYSGEDSSLKLLRKLNKGTVFNALMGNCGLRPSLLAIRQNQDLLLCNKESIVIGSDLLSEALKTSKSKVYPVDSEHVALAKILAELKKQGIPKKDIKEVIVTASGGSLRDYPKDKIASVTPQEVLKHPTWAMGSKITVDSATLVNKGFEVIEASYLFSYPLTKVGAIICRESLVHAEVRYLEKGKEKTMVEYSPCSMQVAIAYALSKGKLEIHHNSKDDLEEIKKLHFAEVDHDFYPCFDLTINMSKKYGNIGMIYYNAVDTLAIEAFLAGKIPFLGIYDALKRTYETMPKTVKLSEKNLKEIIADAEKFAKSIVAKE
jgi:1-deoxy-D-xylulose-5-phosphate reductoisomerase